MNRVVYYYSLEEVLDFLDYDVSAMDTTLRIYTLLTHVIPNFDLFLANYEINPEDLVAIKNNVESTTNYVKLFRLIRFRYDNEYIRVDEELSHTYLNPLYNWCKKFASTLFMTFERYNTLLDIYKNNESHLLDKLSGLISHERHGSKQDYFSSSVSASSKISDTPNAQDVASGYDADQYVSDLSKSVGTTNNSDAVTEAEANTTNDSRDTKYLMEKIKDIQEEYQNTLKDWSNEFEGLFLEEAN